MKHGELWLAVNRKIISNILIFLIIFLGLTGCVSNNQSIPETNYFSYFSTNNDFYFFLPVKNNENFVSSFMGSFLDELSSEDLNKIITRTTCIYYSTYGTNLNLASDSLRNFQGIIVGSFPEFFMKRYLNEKSGWKKINNYYSHNSGLNLAFGNNGCIYLSDGNPFDINEINNNIINFDYDSKPAFFIEDPLTFSTVLFGDLKLPISNITGYLNFFDADECYIDVILQLTDARASKPTMIILKLAGVKTSMMENIDDKIIIKNLKMTREQMNNLGSF